MFVDRRRDVGHARRDWKLRREANALVVGRFRSIGHGRCDIAWARSARRFPAHGLVGTEGSGADGPVEVLPELMLVLANFSDRLAHAALHGDAGAFGGRA